MKRLYSAVFVLIILKTKEQFKVNLYKWSLLDAPTWLTACDTGDWRTIIPLLAKCLEAWPYAPLKPNFISDYRKLDDQQLTAACEAVSVALSKAIAPHAQGRTRAAFNHIST